MVLLFHTAARKADGPWAIGWRAAAYSQEYRVPIQMPRGAP